MGEEGREQVPSLESSSDDKKKKASATVGKLPHSPAQQQQQQQKQQQPQSRSRSTTTPLALPPPPQQQQQQQQQHEAIANLKQQAAVVVTKPNTTSTTSSSSSSSSSAAAAGAASTTTLSSSIKSQVRYDYQTELYRFRCYGNLKLYQERPLRKSSSSSFSSLQQQQQQQEQQQQQQQQQGPSTATASINNNNKKDDIITSSQLVCQGIATQLEMISSDVAALPRFHQDYDDSGADQHHHHHHHHHPKQQQQQQQRDSNRGGGGQQQQQKQLLVPQLANLQHPDDIETFMEQQRSFAWTSCAVPAVATAAAATTETGAPLAAATTTTTTTPSTSSLKKHRFGEDNKVWNVWSSFGITDVVLRVRRKHGTIVVPPPPAPTTTNSHVSLFQSDILQLLHRKHRNVNNTKKQSISPNADSPIVAVRPITLLGVGSHEVGLQKNGTIYRGIRSHFKLYNILGISIARSDESSVMAEHEMDLNKQQYKSKTWISQARDVQGFWNKVWINMKRAVVSLHGILSDDFGNRWYKRSSLTLDMFPKTVEMTTNIIVKIVKKFWPNDDDDDDDDDKEDDNSDGDD